MNLTPILDTMNLTPILSDPYPLLVDPYPREDEGPLLFGRMYD